MEKNKFWNSFEEISGGTIFSQKYTVYNISTIGKEWNVKRRYSDFLWLRKYLAKIFPGTIV